MSGTTRRTRKQKQGIVMESGTRGHVKRARRWWSQHSDGGDALEEMVPCPG